MALGESGLAVIGRAGLALRRCAALDRLAAIGRVCARAHAPLARIADAAATAPRGGSSARLGKAWRQHEQRAEQREQPTTPGAHGSVRREVANKRVICRWSIASCKVARGSRHPFGRRSMTRLALPIDRSTRPTGMISTAAVT